VPAPPSFTIVSFCLALAIAPLHAQQPFYTDDPGVTDRGAWHFEFFNEFDALQHPQYPNLRQNTANYKLNYGLPHDLEIDIDTPYLGIFRAGEAAPNALGLGDTNLGLKWNFQKEAANSRAPALGVSFYVEFPTGDSNNQLGSGIVDYWLNFIGQKHLTKKTRITGNAGILFAGNTSTGVIGIKTTRGQVYTYGVSLLHELNHRWTLGTEIYGGFASSQDLGKDQFQILAGGKYTIRNGLTFDFGVIGGKFVASPRIGGQIGVSIDIPAILPGHSGS
jgi:Putative MetA-pathway of phenol degradation